MTRRSLFPAIPARLTGMLEVGVTQKHSLYYEESGNPEGNPVVVLHGGPGGGVADFYRQFFDADAYRIIMFDQRGSGKSTPAAELRENTTWDLVEDIEALRVHLGIDKWVVFGGSWGACLSIAYAEKHTDRVKALVLRGIFTLRRKELLWFYQEGASFIFPDAFEHFQAPIPLVERDDLMSAYYRRLTGTNREEQLACARAWSIWEMTTSRLYVDPESIAKAADDDEFCLKFARIECHYFVHGGFFKNDGQLVDEADVLNGVPGVIVQGRYDLVCPAVTAWELKKKWTTAELKFIDDAGHSCKEEGIIDALIEATEKFKNL